ncbi:MAG TPA: serine/threonine-protein kinase, partial [Terriglobales bacterium]|nr:serine/threonine-protein kinase [Terriglobales bacterium]
MEPKPAVKIGKYEVLDTLGRGGMGVVYRAIDPRIGRLVAIKMITGDYAKDPDYLNRFYREARSTGTLQHGNIVTVYDLGDQDGVPYLVMEYLEGEPLDKIIASRRDLSLPDRLDIIVQACTGLQYAHQHGVVHRDIKPGNIMVLKDGNVKLVDFGIARLGNSSMTATGQMIGTISY